MSSGGRRRFHTEAETRAVRVNETGKILLVVFMLAFGAPAHAKMTPAPALMPLAAREPDTTAVRPCSVPAKRLDAGRSWTTWTVRLSGTARSWQLLRQEGGPDRRSRSELVDRQAQT